ncbi:FAD-binding oxidoreductase [Solicola gregarius]|uniref:FAD-binding oxidoreductase n=1 Tax=Solicola gregarius TaxID=2908642 RepID=A0AA46TG86_9ACTN|nr:FAD-binding oxidoreductase [Solicola gregarius]UYM04623.1 FAD-binding oxidoreductase [Solicola gregarius]
MIATTTYARTAASDLERSFHGAVLRPGDDRYDAERLSWYRTIDPRPAVIAEATSRSDVAVAVRVAREHGLPLTIQSTGHGTISPAEGMLLRTSLMAGVEIDPGRRLARVEPGALWSDVIAAAAPYGLAPLSGTPAVGVVGYTLGGGAGWLSRTHGYAADSLTAAEIVTSDGEVRRVDGERHPDLYWALRGGGGAFAAVTALEFYLYPVGQVWSGLTMYPFDRAASALAAYRDWSATEPDVLNTSVTAMRVPPMPQLPEEVRGRLVLALRVFGSEPNAAGLAEPLTAAAGEPLFGGFGELTFADAAHAAGPPPPPMAARQHIDLVREVPDALLDTVVEAAEESPAVMAIELRHWGGAMARSAPGHGPVGHRDLPYSVVATAVDSDPDSGAADQVASIADRVRPYASGLTFRNFETDPARMSAAYTAEDYARLTQIKTAWDPDGVFGPEFEEER